MKHRSNARFFTLVACLQFGIFFFTAIQTFAQTYGKDAYDGYTPPSLAQGTPAGTYPLSGFDTVNNFNGKLSVALPLYSIGGRGKVGFPLTLTLDNHWAIHQESQFGTGSWVSKDVIFQPGEYFRVGYSPGYMIGSTILDQPLPIITCPGAPIPAYLTRLRFIAPNGTEYVFFDKKSNGRNCSRF